MIGTISSAVLSYSNATYSGGATRYPVSVRKRISGFRGAGGNTRQTPSACRKKKMERDVGEVDLRASTHLMRELAKVNRVMCTGALAEGASHFSISERKELS
ncbi:MULTISPECIES: hypothetical protein [Burkholderia cepacia complex]|uniref:hypothetical protein n=1 Tax=Burkholderia cepacia complex TaxID=87882 RepID=UPI00136496C6|nr:MULTISPECIES: hypothetical protein [Burkholderia cepacia complex]MBY4798458.1 hypothetical protein [Burkholderia cepacia]